MKLYSCNLPCVNSCATKSKIIRERRHINHAGVHPYRYTHLNFNYNSAQLAPEQCRYRKNRALPQQNELPVLSNEDVEESTRSVT